LTQPRCGPSPRPHGRRVAGLHRLQPGRTVKYSTNLSVIEHDATTLGGNSGSPVADPTTHHVIGPHVGGRYGLGNSAVPLCMLIGDPLLAKGGVKFQ
jgi:hypothetical protein